MHIAVNCDMSVSSEIGNKNNKPTKKGGSRYFRQRGYKPT